MQVKVYLIQVLNEIGHCTPELLKIEGPGSDPNCAVQFRGGWCYDNCYDCNLNGAYDSIDSHIGVIWRSLHGTSYSIPFVELKMKPM